MNVIKDGLKTDKRSIKPRRGCLAYDRGRGRGQPDFDIIQFRPQPCRATTTTTTTSGTGSGFRTPSNLELALAIRATVHRNKQTSSSASAGPQTLQRPKPFRQQLAETSVTSTAKRRSLLNGFTSTSTYQSESSTPFKTPKRPRTLPKTPRNSSSATPRTPASASTSTDREGSSHVILALTEGRGKARGEVGLAVIDIKSPKLVLCQLSDSQTYSNTLTKINVFHPVEILIPNTFVEGNQINKLYTLLEDRFRNVNMVKVQRRLFRDSDGLQKIKNLALTECASLHLIVQEKFYALAAASALLSYVEFMQKVIFTTHSLKIEFQGAQHGTVIDVKTAEALELLLNRNTNNVKNSLISFLDHCKTIGGSRRLRASLLHPPCSLPVITKRLDSVQELVQNQDLAGHIQNALKDMPDVESLLTLCMQTPTTLDNTHSIETRMNYIILLKVTLDTIPHLATALREAECTYFCKALEILQNPQFEQMRKEILEIINEDVKSTKGTRNAQFQRCFAVKTGVNELMDVARKTYCEIISDIHNHVTSLGEQYALPLKLNMSATRGYHIQIHLQKIRRSVKDSDLPPIFLQVSRNRTALSCTTDVLIHGNDRIKLVTNDILEMSNVLLSDLLKKIREHMSCLYQISEIVAELDVISSLAQYSSVENNVRPDFGDVLEIKAARHPILDSIASCDLVANDVHATPWKNLSIVTGPNMSGKSICVRQVLLLQIMSQVGCYVPAERATFRIADRIFSHLNFDDSIENNASTLSLEMEETQLMLSCLTSTSLVGLDEICRGTSVEEGTALSWAICEKLSQSSAFVFFTTHFSQLANLASIYPCISNVHLETSEDKQPDGKAKLIYTHRLLPGSTNVKHYGLRLAETFEMPPSIVEEAYDIATRIEADSQVHLMASTGDDQYITSLTYLTLKELSNKENLSGNELRKAIQNYEAALALAVKYKEDENKNKKAQDPIKNDTKDGQDGLDVVQKNDVILSGCLVDYSSSSVQSSDVRQNISITDESQEHGSNDETLHQTSPKRQHKDHFIESSGEKSKLHSSKISSIHPVNSTPNNRSSIFTPQNLGFFQARSGNGSPSPSCSSVVTDNPFEEERTRSGNASSLCFNTPRSSELSPSSSVRAISKGTTPRAISEGFSSAFSSFSETPYSLVCSEVNYDAGPSYSPIPGYSQKLPETHWNLDFSPNSSPWSNKKCRTQSSNSVSSSQIQSRTSSQNHPETRWNSDFSPNSSPWSNKNCRTQSTNSVSSSPIQSRTSSQNHPEINWNSDFSPWSNKKCRTQSTNSVPSSPIQPSIRYIHREEKRESFYSITRNSDTSKRSLLSPNNDIFKPGEGFSTCRTDTLQNLFEGNESILCDIQNLPLDQNTPGSSKPVLGLLGPFKKRKRSSQNSQRESNDLLVPNNSGMKITSTLGSSPLTNFSSVVEENARKPSFSSISRFTNYASKSTPDSKNQATPNMKKTFSNKPSSSLGVLASNYGDTDSDE